MSRGSGIFQIQVALITMRWNSWDQSGGDSITFSGRLECPVGQSERTLSHFPGGVNCAIRQL